MRTLLMLGLSRIRMNWLSALATQLHAMLGVIVICLASAVLSGAEIGQLRQGRVIRAEVESLYGFRTEYALFNDADVVAFGRMFGAGTMVAPFSRLHGLKLEVGDKRFELDLALESSEQFLDIAGLRLVAGDNFGQDEAKNRAGVLMSTALARTLFSDQSVVGKSLRLLERSTGTTRTFTVFGVYQYEPSHAQDLAHLILPVGAMSNKRVTANVLVRSSMGAELLDTAKLYFKDNSVFQQNKRGLSVVQTIAEQPLSRSRPLRFDVVLLLVLAAVAVATSAIGVLQSLILVIQQSRRAGALRRALGASRVAVVAELIFEACLRTFPGAVVGAGVSWLWFHESRQDPVLLFQRQLVVQDELMMAILFGALLFLVFLPIVPAVIVTVGPPSWSFHE
jgi:ABC-type antimicrobial peptide transport system permease subunit